jgi:tryptophanyl-tRNA synthetase
VDLQNSAEKDDKVIYSIVGYHAITMPQDPKTLREDRMNALAYLLAVGIDWKRSILFHQDQVCFKAKHSSLCSLCIEGPATYRTSLDTQLYHTDGEIKQDDDVEGVD